MWKWSPTVTNCEAPQTATSKGVSVIVNRLDPDGHLRDLIDVALQRYHQRRDVDEGNPSPNHERPSDG